MSPVYPRLKRGSHTATHCNTLQRTYTHVWNGRVILQHTATHCNAHIPTYETGESNYDNPCTPYSTVDGLSLSLSLSLYVAECCSVLRCVAVCTLCFRTLFYCRRVVFVLLVAPYESDPHTLSHSVVANTHSRTHTLVAPYESDLLSCVIYESYMGIQVDFHL